MPTAFPKRTFDVGAALRAVALRGGVTRLDERLAACASLAESLVTLFDAMPTAEIARLLREPAPLRGLEGEPRHQVLKLLRFLEDAGLFSEAGDAHSRDVEIVPEELRPTLHELLHLIRALVSDSRPDRLWWGEAAWRIVDEEVAWGEVLTELAPRLRREGSRFGSDPDVELRMQTCASWSVDTLPAALRQDVVDLREAFSATALRVMSPLWYLVAFLGRGARESVGIAYGAACADEAPLVDLAEQLRALNAELTEGWELRLDLDPRVQRSWRTTRRFLRADLNPDDPDR